MASRVSPKLLRNLPYSIRSSFSISSSSATTTRLEETTHHHLLHQTPPQTVPSFTRSLNSSSAVSPFHLTTNHILTATTATPPSSSTLSLDDVEKLFSSLSTFQLLRSLFNLNLASFDPIVDLGIWVMRSKLMETPGFREIVLSVVKHTFYEHFCAGENLQEASKTLQKLWDNGLRGILDYGLEDAVDNRSCDRNLHEFLLAVESTKFLPPSSVSYACVKITAICPISLLKRVSDLLRWEYENPSFELPWKQETLPFLTDSSPFYHTLTRPDPLTPVEEEDLKQAHQRLFKLSEKCHDMNLPLLVDAEYTSVQPAIDYLTYSAMTKFNGDNNAIVFGTVQTYLKDAQERTIQATEAAEKMGITMGLKLVRGAYLSSESQLASSLGYSSPIHGSIQETHKCYNDCASFMIEKVATGSGAVVLATHNLESGKAAAAKAQALGIGKGNPKLQFAQLKGMAEGLSYGLRNAGFQPAYITQCPMQTGQSYVYNFTIVGQRGTLWWHAHISWLRSTLYGPIVILPKLGVPYPFAKPYQEVPIIFGEWFKTDTDAIINQALQTGGGPKVSDAYTINGLPGPLYNCSSNDTFRLKVKPGKTYLLRLINAALNDELFFSIANHTLTIVDADAVYVKPFNTNILLLTPGQTTNVLLKTKSYSPNATFLMAARPYVTGLGTFDNSTTTAILEYEHSSNNIKKLPLFKPTLPQLNDTAFATDFTKKLRSLNSAKFPAKVPKTINKRFFFTVGLGTNPCPSNQTCQGPNNSSKFAASVNNVSFIMPTTALLQTHFLGQANSVFTTDFPTAPLIPFNYTGTSPNNTNVSNGTKVVVLPFNSSVELVMQDTSILGAESHPLHLHGFNFFVVGQGFGNYNPNSDPAKFNLVDPVERNTVGVPSGGWVAIRFFADNPGVWFMHCHLEVHTSWGLKMAWVVNDGKLPNQKLPPPPSDLPKC